ncbi:MAG: sigma 54-interacting transcriptional regulator [Desulfobacterales bacterium]|nr:sigma 54-interacting transcriptional regulator [Desulfobacterales bacterium]
MTISPQSFFDNAVMGILGVDSQGIVQYINSHAGNMLYPELAPGKALKLFDPFLAGQVSICLKKRRSFHTFYVVIRGNTLAVTVTLTEDGSCADGVVCFIQDLAVVEKAAWKLPNIREMKLQFQTLVDHSYYGIYILDGSGIVLKVNDVAAGLIGMEKEQMVGMDIRFLADDGIVDQALTPTILKSKKPLTRPLYVVKRNKYIMASGMPILDDEGNILFVVVIEHDMTIVKELRTQLERAREVAETIKSELSDRNLLEMRDSKIIADSPAMTQVLTVLLKLAKMDASNILITGESGTGKGFLSKFIHKNGTRKTKPFISVNCAALPDMLLEAELFGYEKGAFTGASDTGKAGLFELANQGTIFLDEIGDLPFSVQAKLLKCLDDGELRRLGGTKAIKVDCIVIAATNHNLEELVQRKKFRQDLYFRLNIFPVHVPPLRERREDILQISQFYLKKYNKHYKQKKQFSEKCIEQLQTYDFPGNVRELKNIIKNAVVIKEKNVLTKILPSNTIRSSPRGRTASRPVKPLHSAGLNEELMAFERKKLEQALNKHDSTRGLSEYLRISQSTVVRKLKKHGLSVD